jgi:hypothetical protein
MNFDPVRFALVIKHVRSLAPEKLHLAILEKRRSDSSKLALERSTSWKSALIRFEEDRSHPERSIPDNLAPERSTHCRSAERRLTPFSIAARTVLARVVCLDSKIMSPDRFLIIMSGSFWEHYTEIIRGA